MNNAIESQAAPKQADDKGAKATAAEDNICVVCFKNVDIYSIGECDHPVCYECSTRMRVLCQQNECPICRQVLSKVIFTYDKLPYRQLEAKNRSEYYNKKYKIGFYTCDIQQQFFELLDHPCPKCNVPPYRTFQGLRNHVRKEHDLYYCDLCVEHLKIFTFERCCYTQADLNRHRIKGDIDNTSHRGHPLCEYCNKRYLDRDELFRHLRREHYFCHFCDADGCNEFYRDYAALADHFRQDHYLCEEGKCATEEFTGAFRSEIDYKAHVANVHGKSMNKQQAKQTRTLQLEITLGPRGRSGPIEQGVASMRSRGNENVESDIQEPALVHAAQNPQINPGSEQEFPSLARSSGAPNVSLIRPPPSSLLRSRFSGLARTKENFPALGPGSTTSLGGVRGQQQNPPISSMLRKPPNPATGAIPRSTAVVTIPPPPPPKTPTTQTATTNGSGIVIHVSNRPNNTSNQSLVGSNKKAFSMDFPALLTGKMKKHATTTVMDSDEAKVSASVTQIPPGVVPSKHRSLIEEYVSVANPSTFHKIQIVQKDEQDAKARKEADNKNVPKLTNQNFPSLGGATPTHSPQPAATWVKNANISDKKQKEMENRKNKIAPTPILTKLTTKTTTTNNGSNASLINSSLGDNNNKKDNGNGKKAKEKKTKERNNNNHVGDNKSINNSLSEMNNSAAQLRPPPGFGHQSEGHKPPGSHSNKVTLTSVAKSPNNLTFTSSLGQSFTIIPAHSYTPPTDALQRNQKLVEYFKEALKSPEALEEFRHISQQFREGVYKTQPYYEHCQAALKEKFDKIFPELVFLLPDISKQQALYLVHQQHLNTLSPVQRKALPKLQVCSICKQVLAEHDTDNHQKMHELKENFPQLNGSHHHHHHKVSAAST